jgi:hypothetical protein
MLIDSGINVSYYSDMNGAIQPMDPLRAPWPGPLALHAVYMFKYWYTDA